MARQSALLPFTRSWCVPACLRARVVMTTAVVAAGVAGGGCERIQEDGPAFDEEDVRDVKDVRDVVAPDIPKIIDTLKFDAKPKKDLIVADVPDPTPESCDNGSDDDDDGLIDEAGCEPGPNLRPDQTWTDLGTVSLVEQAGPAPTLPFGVSVKNQGTVLVARDISATRRYVWAESLTSPAGVQVLTPGAWATSLNRGAVGLGYGTATLGMSPKVNVLAGPWQTGFVRADVQPAEYQQVPTPGTLHVGVLSRPEIPGVQAAALDLDVWCAGSVPMPCKELEASWQWQQLATKPHQLQHAPQVCNCCTPGPQECHIRTQEAQSPTGQAKSDSKPCSYLCPQPLGSLTNPLCAAPQGCCQLPAAWPAAQQQHR